jgi:hypothetical protein
MDSRWDKVKYTCELSISTPLLMMMLAFVPYLMDNMACALDWDAPQLSGFLSHLALSRRLTNSTINVKL